MKKEEICLTRRLVRNWRVDKSEYVKEYYRVYYTEILGKPTPLGVGQLPSAIVRISVSKSPDKPQGLFDINLKLIRGAEISLYKTWN